MRQFFHLFFTNHRWFVGTLIAISIITIFLWGWIDPDSYKIAWNHFATQLKALLQGAVALALIFLAFKFMLKGSGGKKSH